MRCFAELDYLSLIWCKVVGLCVHSSAIYIQLDCMKAGLAEYCEQTKVSVAAFICFCQMKGVGF